MLEDSNATALASRQPDGAGEAEACAPGFEQPASSMMTPAKRAGLAALEREFSELLKKRRP